MTGLGVESIRAAIERYGSAQVSTDRLAALAGAHDLNAAGWAEIEQWLEHHGLIVISRGDGCETNGLAQASIMAR
jgi:hypothetical protein